MIKLLEVLENYNDFTNILEDYSKQELSFDEKWELFSFKHNNNIDITLIHHNHIDTLFLKLLTIFLKEIYCDTSNAIYFVDIVNEFDKELQTNILKNDIDFINLITRFDIRFEDVLQKYKEEILKLNYTGVIYG